MTSISLISSKYIFIFMIGSPQGGLYLLKGESVSSDFYLLISQQADKFTPFVFLFFSFLSFLFQVPILLVINNISNICYWMGKQKTKNLYSFTFCQWLTCLMVEMLIVLFYYYSQSAVTWYSAVKSIQDSNTFLLQLNIHKLILE